MHPVRWTWLLPIVAGAVALGVVLTRHEPAPAPRSEVEGLTTFVAADATGHGHAGIIQGPVQRGQPGHDGSAFSFAERGAWIMVPSSPQLNAGTSNFLVTVWVQVESSVDAGETYDIVRKGIAYTVPGEFKLELLGSGQVRCTAKDNANRSAQVTSELTLSPGGGWHKIGCARTGRHWSVLVDDLISSVAVDLGGVSNSVALSIGSKYGLEDRPLGLIDDVKLMINRDASPKGRPVAAIRELEQLAPVAWWRLDEAATTGTGR